MKLTTPTAAAHAQRVKEDADDNAHKSLVPKKKVPDSTPPDTDVALLVPAVVKVIIAEDIQRELSVFPNLQRGPSSHRLLVELGEELRRKATKSSHTQFLKTLSYVHDKSQDDPTKCLETKLDVCVNLTSSQGGLT